MRWTARLDYEHLAQARFVLSPLYETVRALLAVRDDAPPRLALAAWARWARAEAARTGLAAPLASELIANGRPTFPEIFVPAPLTSAPTIGSELQAVAGTPHEVLRASFGRVWRGVEPPPAARAGIRRPTRLLQRVAAELQRVHDVLIAPSWPRMQRVMEADVAFRARTLAQSGFSGLFATLQPQLRWEGGVLSTGDGVGWDVRMQPGGLVLMPTILGAPRLNFKITSSTQTVLHYPARGAATLFDETRPVAGSGLDALIGAGRARVLRALAAPSTPTELATALGITPSAVVQQLRVLRDGGLVRSERLGRSALYVLTETGEALLNPTAW